MTDSETVETRRWEVGLAAALLAGGVGLVTGNATVFLATTVGLVYAAYGYVNGPPTDAVAVDRAVDDDSPLPGAEVTVTLTVTNAGDEPLPDLRVVDGVPRGIEVVDGTPGFATTLAAGESATHSYAVRARRGEHTFGKTVVLARNVSGALERRRRVSNPTELTCRSGPEGLPLRERTVPHTGRIETDDGGEGVEFYATRSYRPGDPMNRVDWNRYARTNELTTVEYRQERAGIVVVLVDTRNDSRVARRSVEPDGVELGTYAAEEVVDTLLDRQDRVGVAIYDYHGGYLPPGTGRAQGLRARKLLREGAEVLQREGYGAAGYDGRTLSELRRRMPPEAQVVLVSPLLDDAPVSVVRRLRAHGHPVTVVSLNVTGSDSPGSTLARIDRAHRVHELREDETRVLEWSPDEPLHTAVSRAERRWTG